MRAKRLAAATMAASLLLAGAACGDNQSEREPGDLTQEKPLNPDIVVSPLRKLNYIATYATMGNAYIHMWQTGDVLSASIAQQKGLGETQSAGVNLRSDLGELLGGHALLASIATQKIADHAPDAEGAMGQLDKNSDALGEAIGAVYPEAKDAFLKGWKEQVRMYSDFATSVRNGEPTKKAQSAEELAGFTNTFGELLGGIVGLPGPAVTETLKAHVAHITGAVEQYRAKEFDKSYAEIRAGYSHALTMADTLAGAIATQKGLGATTGKAGDLRYNLGSMLGQHAVFASLATQKGFGGESDFTNLAASLDLNSDELGAAIGSVYGDAAKNEFLKQWKDHIRMFVDLTLATKDNDGAKLQAATAELDGYTTTFGAFLGNATGVAPTVVSNALKLHVDQLVRALNEYSGKV